MTAIGPGDWVECVKGATIKGPGCKLARSEGVVIEGHVYCVREVFRGRYADGSRDDGLRLVGVYGYNDHGAEGGWPACLFRPLYRPDPEALRRALLAPVDEAQPVKELIGEGEPRSGDVRASTKDTPQ